MLADPIGALDSPTAGQSFAGVIPVSGFVLDFAGVDKVELWVDGVLRSRTQANMPRADVLDLFPSYASSPTRDSGFMTSLNGRTLSVGQHLVTIKVTETGNSRVFDLATVAVFVVATNQGPFGSIDSPSASQTGISGSFPVSGWAADDSGVIDHIDILVDGKIVAGAVSNGQASTGIYGLARPDVFAVFPDVPNSGSSGFLANIDTTAFLDGVHVISARAFDGEGASGVIGSRTVQIINNGANLPPFGFLDVPLDKASILCSTDNPFVESSSCPEPCFPTGIEGLSVPVSFYKNIVAGWALDVGSRLDRGQVSYVELLIDGEIIANTRRDCIRTGKVMANCYGVNRPDVARAFPGYVNADNSGFLFLFSVERDCSNWPETIPCPIEVGSGLFSVLVPGPFGFPVVAGLVASGKHTISIRVGDEKETVSQIAAISVDVLCDTGKFVDQPAFGYIDVPTDLQFVKGMVTFSGWAFDYDNGGQDARINGILRLDMDIDGKVETSIFPPYIARADVPANDYRVPATLFSVGPVAFVGWGFVFDTGTLSDGQHDFVVYAADTPNAATGRPSFRTEIGRRKFVVFNNTTKK